MGCNSTPGSHCSISILGNACLHYWGSSRSVLTRWTQASWSWWSLILQVWLHLSRPFYDWRIFGQYKKCDYMLTSLFGRLLGLSPLEFVFSPFGMWYWASSPKKFRSSCTAIATGRDARIQLYWIHLSSCLNTSASTLRLCCFLLDGQFLELNIFSPCHL